MGNILLSVLDRSDKARRNSWSRRSEGSGMGNLLRLVIRDDAKKEDIRDVFVDFENCQPTEAERAVWNKLQVVLEKGYAILRSLKDYKGASNEIREAISHARDEELQQKAWEAVCPLTVELRKYYEFSILLEQSVPDLLEALCSSEMSAKEHLDSQQALVKQFAEILDFVLKFDDLKLTNPVIQNDFSYYRRTQSRRRMATDDTNETEELVPNEMANRMSLFYASPTPMLEVLSKTTADFVAQRKDIPVENTTDCLSTMANICRIMIENPEYLSRIQHEDTKLFCLRVMVGVIILYDHVHHVGAFSKTSGIDMKSSIKLLKEQKDGGVEGLLNALRYTTKHLNDEATPRSIKVMLADQ